MIATCTTPLCRWQLGQPGRSRRRIARAFGVVVHASLNQLLLELLQQLVLRGGARGASARRSRSQNGEAVAHVCARAWGACCAPLMLAGQSLARSVPPVLSRQKQALLPKQGGCCAHATPSICCAQGACVQSAPAAGQARGLAPAHLLRLGQAPLRDHALVVILGSFVGFLLPQGDRPHPPRAMPALHRLLVLAAAVVLRVPRAAGRDGPQERPAFVRGHIGEHSRLGSRGLPAGVAHGMGRQSVRRQTLPSAPHNVSALSTRSRTDLGPAGQPLQRAAAGRSMLPLPLNLTVCSQKASGKPQVKQSILP